MLNALENNVENKDLPNDSKLRQLSGCRDPISMVTLRTGTRLSIKNETEILIPKTMRYVSMMGQSKGKIFWPNLRKDLKK